jgi:hypothetical protein
MNSQSNLLLVIGVFLITDSCFGQRPLLGKPIRHFATDIIKVDSILSIISHCNIQRTSNIPSPNQQFNNGKIRFELIRGNCDWKIDSISPTIPEMDRSKKYD